MPRLTPAGRLSLVEFHELEHLDEALARGRGVIMISAHLGNWEVLGGALAARGDPLHVVAREIFDARSDRLLNAVRRELGVIVHPRQAGLFPVVRALRAGHIVGTLVDQDTEGPGVFTDFFGVPARTPRAPFALARRLGAALVPVLIRLDASGCHRVRVFPELKASGAADEEQALKSMVEAWNRILETSIRAHPEQWVWHHRRWKSRPSAVVTDLREFSKKSLYPTKNQYSRESVGAR
jgi:KDO2-lipid IV(A) lauroyltransferase